MTGTEGYDCPCGSHLKDGSSSNVKRHETQTKRHQIWVQQQQEKKPAPAPTPVVEKITPQVTTIAPRGDRHVSVRSKVAKKAQRMGYDIPGSDNRRRKNRDRREPQKPSQEPKQDRPNRLPPTPIIEQEIADIRYLGNRLRRILGLMPESFMKEFMSSYQSLGGRETVAKILDFRFDCIMSRSKRNRKPWEEVVDFPYQNERWGWWHRTEPHHPEFDREVIHQIKEDHDFGLEVIQAMVDTRMKVLGPQLKKAQKRDEWKDKQTVPAIVHRARDPDVIQKEISQLMSNNMGGWDGKMGRDLRRRLKNLRQELDNAHLKEKAKKLEQLNIIRAKAEELGVDPVAIGLAPVVKPLERVEKTLQEKKEEHDIRQGLYRKRLQRTPQKEAEFEKVKLKQAEEDRGSVRNVTLERFCPKCREHGLFGKYHTNRANGCIRTATKVPKRTPARPPKKESRSSGPTIPLKRKEDKPYDGPYAFDDTGVDWKSLLDDVDFDF